MKKILFITVCIISFSCKESKKDEQTKVDSAVKTSTAPNKILMHLNSKSGSNATGTIEFVQAHGVVSLKAKLSGLTEGKHAIHIHQTADCSSDDGKSAGGHWNPTAQPHGQWGAKNGYHKGDIGNFLANAQGEGRITFSTKEWCIGCGDKNRDILGKGIIVHQGADDYTSQPSGAAGKRVSCAGIIQ